MGTSKSRKISLIRHLARELPFNIFWAWTGLLVVLLVAHFTGDHVSDLDALVLVGGGFILGNIIDAAKWYGHS